MEAIAADAVLTNKPGEPNDPDEFAEHCIRLVTAMVVDDDGTNRWTIEEVRRLEDGVIQQVVVDCLSKREEDQEQAIKNFEAVIDEAPSVSLQGLASATSTKCSRPSANVSSSNGASQTSSSEEKNESEPETAELETEEVEIGH